MDDGELQRKLAERFNFTIEDLEANRERKFSSRQLAWLEPEIAKARGPYWFTALKGAAFFLFMFLLLGIGEGVDASLLVSGVVMGVLMGSLYWWAFSRRRVVKATGRVRFRGNIRNPGRSRNSSVLRPDRIEAVMTVGLLNGRRFVVMNDDEALIRSLTHARVYGVETHYGYRDRLVHLLSIEPW